MLFCMQKGRAFAPPFRCAHSFFSEELSCERNCFIFDCCSLVFDCYHILGNGDIQCFCDVSIVFFCDAISYIADCHLCGICAVCQNFISHFRCLYAQIIVADGQSCQTTAAAHAFFTGYNRNPCGNRYVLYDFCVICDGVVCRDIQCITFADCLCYNRLYLVGICCCKFSPCNAFLIQLSLCQLRLICRVGFCRAVYDANLLCREPAS